MQPTRPSRLLNLTGTAISFCKESGDPIVTVPSDGELKLKSINGPRFIHHHVHYYNETSNDEAGLPVLQTNHINKLDKNSVGYHDFAELDAGDSVIVHQNVAQFLTNRPGLCDGNVFHGRRRSCTHSARSRQPHSWLCIMRKAKDCIISSHSPIKRDCP